MASWVVLICAVFASLTGGVALAYGVCAALFTAFRVHSQSVASTAAQQTVVAGS